jgi:aspartate carbamoyltransferase catalytic subunit
VLELAKFLHVLKSQQFNRKTLEEVFNIAGEMKKVVERGGSADLYGKRIITLFYEPSTRTRASFEAAISYLGGTCMFSTENAREFSSVAKGETLEDTIRTLCCYHPDAIVLRHPEIGAAKRAAKVSSQVPIINAGDGVGQHPTQALLDLYTIQQKIGQVDNTTIAMVGDLMNGRTVRSLAYLLGKYSGVKIYFVAPKVVRIRDDIKDYLSRHDIIYEETEDLSEVAGKVDVIYQTRIQKERFGDRIEDYKKAKGIYIINQEVMDLMKRDAIVMHPLPRVDEIDPAVDSDPRAIYFEQAQNGLYIRMAILIIISGNIDRKKKAERRKKIEKGTTE